MDQLHEIVKLLKDQELTEITICEGEQRITVRQGGPVGVMPTAPSAPVAPVAETAPAPEIEEGTITLKAPLVGTFYRRPTPDDEPFVASGAIVEPGDTVCIIEAMKVMNEIKAEAHGRLLRVLVDDGAPVEYGQDLAVFEKL